MTDRELLELAAKAAGVVLVWGGPDSDMARRADNWNNWNPLTDDGDALRLAAKLHMEVAIFTDECHTRCVERGHTWVVEEGDPSAATRRAIVRAAAAIGQSMKGKK